MDRKLNNKIVINAVAGSGKTSYIIDQLSIDTKKILIITYTTANQENLKERVINKFGCRPSNIFIYGYFEFLLRFIIKPLCPYTVRDICFENPQNYRNPNPFTNNKSKIYANRMAKYILENLAGFKNRIERYFDEVYIDEMQDLASDDFKWMLSLSDLDIPVTLVGDFYQFTFASSRRGNHLKNLYKDFSTYKKMIEMAGFKFDETTLIKSHRCTSSVCNFIKERIGIDIESAKNNSSVIRLITEGEEIKKILENKKIKKLFYRDSKKYNVDGDNWGNSKGMTFEHVCIVLNDTTYKKYDKNELNQLAPQTLCKFYVACTRTSGDLFFIKEKDVPIDYKIST
ncbi:UvrD-helicase domain-containing protein [Bacillus paralicheniformis]|uniref:UvrD-helicase domain-containing protein n=1 Tax=Bacillus paralicheniformis TaxID=1648923 RepID=UPI002E241AA4|nr:UvrD-helicase domain-containing protein [Bacillus paralicheniformis]